MRSKTHLQSLLECLLCVADGYHLQGQLLNQVDHSGACLHTACTLPVRTDKVPVRDALSSHIVRGISLADKSG